MCSNSCNDVLRVAQRYGIIAAHTRRRASVLVVFVVFCVHMYSFAGLIRRTPPSTFSDTGGWSGGAMVLDKLPMPGRPTIWIIVGQGPTALAVGAGGGCLDIFTLIYPFSPLSPSLWETARYGLKYCLKGPLNPKQPTNQNQ